MTQVVDQTLYDELVATRRDLHRHPELSWGESRTADRICAFLDRHGVSYRRDVAGTGVVAEIPGTSDGSCVALRADMDALPIREETGLPFASVNDGVMHACGHDAHSSMLLGAAALLAREKALPAPVRLVFQPAEELGEGARAMIEAGVLDRVDQIFGAHVDRHFPVGTIVVTDGSVNASTDSFRVVIRGRSAHAARPHEGIDAVVVAMLIVSTIQTIVSREVNPAHPSVVTIGRVVAGTAANVIAGEAVLEGTVRAQEDEIREQLVAAVRRMATSAGQLHGAEVDFELVGSSPAVINPPEMTEIAREAAVEVVGSEHVRRLDIANMGAEDFAEYLQVIPGCYVRLGSQVPGREGFPAHSSRFDVDENVLAVGAAYYHALARLAGARLAAQRSAEGASPRAEQTPVAVRPMEGP